MPSNGADARGVLALLLLGVSALQLVAHPVLCCQIQLGTCLQTITDLLDPSRTNLQVRENLEGQYVSNLTAHEVYRGARCWLKQPRVQLVRKETRVVICHRRHCTSCFLQAV